MLREIYGPDSVACPELHTRRVYRWGMFGVCAVALATVVTIVLTLLWSSSNQMTLTIGFGTACAAAALGWLIFYGSAARALYEAEKAARQSYDRLQPNVVVAVGFGAVVARRLTRSKPALLLIQPAVIRYDKLVVERRHRRWYNYPYIMVVDERGTPNVNEQFRLMNRMDPVRSRLELFEPNTISKTGLTQTELKSLVDNVYEHGKQGAAELALIAPDVTVPLQMF